MFSKFSAGLITRQVSVNACTYVEGLMAADTIAKFTCLRYLKYGGRMEHSAERFYLDLGTWGGSAY